MSVVLLGVIGIVIDVVIILALLLGIMYVADMVRDFLSEYMVHILVDMPSFDYGMAWGLESGNVMFSEYRRQRDIVVWPLVAAGAVAWLATGRFGHRIRHVIQSEDAIPVDVHDTMKPGMQPGTAAYGTVSLGMGYTMPGWFAGWMAGLPSKCLAGIILVLLLPPVWDAAVDGSGWAASLILNPVYSGDPQYPCPREWYYDGVLDLSNADLLEHHASVVYLLVHDDTGRLDAMCRPEMRVKYMIEQWGGQTKAIPPPGGDSFWEMIAAMDHVVSEFFINVILGLIKAQAVIMSGTAMIISNMVVDVGVATVLLFAPVYLALAVLPWEHVGGAHIMNVIRTYGPASLAAAIIYPLEVAMLFAVSSEIMIYMLLSEYGDDMLLVWLFGTAIMSMVVAMPVVSLGAFASVTGRVTEKFTTMIQTAQGGMGHAAGMGRSGGGVAGRATGRA